MSKGALFQGFLILCWLGATPYAHAGPTEAYDILGVKPGAPLTEIEKAYQKKFEENQDSPEAEGKIDAAHEVLSNPVTRKQYDAGKGGDTEVELPPGRDRKELADLLKPLDPVKATRLQKIGRVSFDTLSNMGTFYLTVGVSELWKCYSTRDPNFCKKYVDSLKEPSGHIGFGLFVGTSKLAEMGIAKMFGKKATAETAGRFLGLGAGSLVNEVFADFVNNPATKKYLDALWYLRGTDDGKAQRAEALHELYTKTVGQKSWYTEKAPGLVALLGASLAAERTWSLVNKGLAGGASRLRARQARQIAGGMRPTGCGVSIFLQKYLFAAESLKGFPAFAQKRVMEIGGLAVFLGWSAVLNPPVKRAWEAGTLDFELAKSRGEMLALLTRYRKAPTPTLQKIIEVKLKTNAALWDDYRRRRMAPAEELMSLHAAELTAFDQAVNKPFTYYSWFLTGFDPADPTWKNIVELYFPWAKNLRYERGKMPGGIQKEVDRYLHTFFCGEDPAKSFSDALNVHGVPVPFRMSAQVGNYRAVAKIDPALCKLPPAELEKEFTKKDGPDKKDYQPDLRRSHVTLRLRAHDARQKKLDFYENEITDRLTKVLKAQGKMPIYQLPTGVMSSFEAEMKDLAFLATLAKGTDLSKTIASAAAHQQKKAESAQQLLTYVETPPGKRELPDTMEFDEVVNASNDSGSEEDEGWQSIVRYFNGYLLH